MGLPDDKRCRHVHGFLTPNNLNRHFLAHLVRVALENTRSDDIGKHAFTERREDLIAPSVQLFAEDDLVITLGISCSVEGRCDDRRGCLFLERNNRRHEYVREGGEGITLTTTRLTFLTFFFSVVAMANISSTSSSSSSSSSSTISTSTGSSLAPQTRLCSSSRRSKLGS